MGGTSRLDILCCGGVVAWFRLYQRITRGSQLRKRGDGNQGHYQWARGPSASFVTFHFCLPDRWYFSLANLAYSCQSLRRLSAIQFSSGNLPHRSYWSSSRLTFPLGPPKPFLGASINMGVGGAARARTSGGDLFPRRFGLYYVRRELMLQFIERTFEAIG